MRPLLLCRFVPEIEIDPAKVGTSNFPFDRILQAAGDELAWMIAIRRELHRAPELGLEEFETSRRVRAELERLRIPHRLVSPTGVVAAIRAERPGPVVALRADLDALPLHDEKEVEYRSQVPGKMHACGHDVHTAILLGVARILAARLPLARGEVRLLFQPAEETVGGARLLIAAGALENPPVQAIFGLHVDPELQVGRIGIHPGQRNAASDDILLRVRGRAGHGAYPASGVDAVVVAAQIVVALQTLISRRLDARHSAVLTFGTIHGGVAPNVLAPEVVLEGTLRTIGNEVRESLLAKLGEMTRGVGSALGAEIDLEVRPGYAPLVNHAETTALVGQLASGLFGTGAVRISHEPRLGVEDFGFYLERVPGSFYSLGVRNEERGIVHPAHSTRFDVDESAMRFGAALQCALALAVTSGALEGTGKDRPSC